MPFLIFFILLGKYSSLGFSGTVINYSGWTGPWKKYLIWVVQISNFVAHGNGQRWYQLISLETPENSVHVRIFAKHQKQHQLDFWNLIQICNPNTVNLDWNCQNVSQICPLEVCHKCISCVILMSFAYPLQLNKISEHFCATFVEVKG